MTASSGLGSILDDVATPARVRGGVHFVDPHGAPEAAARHQGDLLLEWLDVRVPAPPWRGTKLRDIVEGAIEQALARCGAPASGISGLADLDATLSDQLYRTRTLGARGIALHVPSLRGATGLAGALDAEDSAVLRWWIEATYDRPVRLLLDEQNRQIGAYGPPTRLELLVGPAVQAFGRGEYESPARDGHLRLHVDLDVTLEGDRPETDEPAHEDVKPAHDHDHDHDGGRHEMGAATATAAPPTAAPATTTAAPSDPAAREPAALPRFGRLMVSRPSAALLDAAPDPYEGRPAQLMPVFPRRETAAAGVPRSALAEPSIDWRAFASDLELARGPKPLAIIERLFMSRYVPLLESVARGETDAPARRTVEQWADNFARSYAEGFSALKVTGKRPRMVLDAPQLCNQIARLHGAKSTQLILVDGMRFDIGVRVQERMASALLTRATCTERLLLWAALPTTTPAQLDLLARGPEGLASPSPPGDREELGVRGRTSATLRRVKIGARDVLKLDAVESRLRESGPPLGERLDAMADEVAQAITAHARTQPPRTLMFIFGDHGFRMASDEVGTSAATTGGASPEEVLVPAFAWLVGDVH